MLRSSTTRMPPATHCGVSGWSPTGNTIAQHHIKVAQRLAAQWWIDLPHPDLAYLVEGTPEFRRYIAELRWAQHFALLNREEMMDRVIRQVSEWVGVPVEELERINCHHNFTESEEHFGKRVCVSRKGAIQADVGRPGLIPGSMGTASYVVEGGGNSLCRIGLLVDKSIDSAERIPGRQLADHAGSAETRVGPPPKRRTHRPFRH